MRSDRHRHALANRRQIRFISSIALVFTLLGATALAPSFIGYSPASASASTSANVTVNFLDAPTHATAEDSFSYRVEVKNLGPDSADGTTVTLIHGDGVQDAQMTCLKNESAPTCPEDANISTTAKFDGRTSQFHSEVTLEHFPARTVYVFRVTGKFPVASSITPTLSAQLPENDESVQPQAITTSQHIALTIVPPNLSFNYYQDKERVAAGETRTYTLTYQNNSDSRSAEIYMHGHFNITPIDAPLNPSVTYSFVCGSNTSGMDCPSWANGQPITKNTSGFFPDMPVTVLPPQATLEIKMPTVVDFTCLKNTTETTVNHRQSFEHTTQQYQRGGQATGTLTGSQCSQETTVTIEQDTESTASGEQRMITVTYRNTNATQPASFQVYGATLATSTPIRDRHNRFSVSCGDGTTPGACPSWVTNEERTSTKRDTNIFNGSVTLPPNGVLELKIPLTTSYSCIGGQSSADHFFRAGAGAKDMANVDSDLRGTLTGPTCGPLGLEVTQEQSAETTAIGEDRVYTVTYRNTTDAEINNLQISHKITQNRSREIVRFTVTCGPETTEGACPSWANGSEHAQGGLDTYTYLEKFSIPAHSTVQFNIPLKLTFDCTPEIKEVPFTAHARWSHTETGENEEAPALTGRVQCVDVATSMSVAINGLPIGNITSPISVNENDTVDYTIGVRTPIGPVNNVPFTVKLPNIVKIEDPHTLTCSSENGASCPPNLHYNSDTHSVEGTFDTLPENSTVTVKLSGIINARGHKVLTGQTLATAPTQWNATPTFGTANPSSVSFGYIPTEIDPPSIPTVFDPCGADNAKWNVPANNEYATWEHKSDGRLIAHAMPAYVFRTSNGTVSEYNYGTAAETNTNPCPAPPVTPPAGPATPSAEPATPVQPSSPAVPPVASTPERPVDPQAPGAAASDNTPQSLPHTPTTATTHNGKSSPRTLALTGAGTQAMLGTTAALLILASATFMWRQRRHHV